jgi:hypothetical protein
MHFPKGEKFVSLLKDAATPEAQARLDAERTRLRGLVRRQLADERLLSEVNEGRQDIPPGTAAQVRIEGAVGGEEGTTSMSRNSLCFCLEADDPTHH